MIVFSIDNFQIIFITLQEIFTMIAISATEKKLTAGLDLRFEKSPWFLIVDTDNSYFIANPYYASDGQTAKVIDLLRKEKVTKIISGEIGPKSKQLLDKYKIQLVFLEGDKVSLQHIANLVSRSEK